MAITVEAVYENGVLRLAQPLGLREHERVQVTVQREPVLEQAASVISCHDPALIEWAASDAELDFPPSPEKP